MNWKVKEKNGGFSGEMGKERSKEENILVADMFFGSEPIANLLLRASTYFFFEKKVILIYTLNEAAQMYSTAVLIVYDYHLI